MIKKMIKKMINNKYKLKNKKMINNKYKLKNKKMIKWIFR